MFFLAEIGKLLLSLKNLCYLFDVIIFMRPGETRKTCDLNLLGESKFRVILFSPLKTFQPFIKRDAIV